MIVATSVSALDPILNMVDKNIPDAHILFSSKQYLLLCEKEIQNENWDVVLKNCLKFLTELPISHRISDKKTAAYSNFRQIASTMLAKHHNYDSIINLLNVTADITEFTKTFFHDIDKKGVHLPKPKPNKVEVIFIYSFCVNFYNMIAVCFDE